VTRTGERRSAYRILVEKPEGMRPVRRPRRKWKYSIKMDVQDVGWRGTNWTDLGQKKPMVGYCKCNNENSGSIKFGGFLD
jgi:hypothetical protein